MEEILQI